MIAEQSIRPQIHCPVCGLGYDQIFDRCPTALLGCGARKTALAGEIAACFDAVDYLVRSLHRLQSVAKRDGHERALPFAATAISRAASLKGTIDMVLTVLRSELEGGR